MKTLYKKYRDEDIWRPIEGSDEMKEMRQILSCFITNPELFLGMIKEFIEAKNVFSTSYAEYRLCDQPIPFFIK